MAVGALTAMAVASVVGAGASIYSGIQQKQAADYNADMAKKEAAAKETQTNEQIRRARIQKQQILGRQRTSALTSGATMSGSSLTALMAESANLESNIADISTAGEAQRMALLNKAYLSQKEGNAAMTTGILSGTSTLLSGVGSSYDFYQKYVKKK